LIVEVYDAFLYKSELICEQCEGHTRKNTDTILQELLTKFHSSWVILHA